MAKQTYTTGQVLTAAQMTALQANDYNWTVSAKTASYVLVAADAGTRITMSNAGATTITVNTALFTAGDTLTITNIGAGACTITAGTATVSTAGSLILNQYDSGTLYFSSTSAAIWNGANPGDITGITTGATSGLAGGVTSGTASLTLATAAKGDLVVGTGANTAQVLTVGSNNQTLVADSTASTGLKYANGAIATLTTTGDTLYASAANTLARRAIGTTGQVLTVAGGLPTWATPGTASFVGANAFRTSSSITLTSNTWTYITFGSELYDTDSFHDTSTNTSRFTVPAGKAGKYLLNFACTFDGVANAYFYLQFFKNGGSALQGGSGVYGQFKDWQANNWSQSISTVTSLSVADYVEGAVLNASTQTDTMYGIFSITYLGA